MNAPHFTVNNAQPPLAVGCNLSVGRHAEELEPNPGPAPLQEKHLFPGFLETRHPGSRPSRKQQASERASKRFPGWQPFPPPPSTRVAQAHFHFLARSGFGFLLRSHPPAGMLTLTRMTFT